MYKLKIQEEALNQLREAVHYIITELGAPQAGEALRDATFSAIASLKEMPYRHSIMDKAFILDVELRIFPIKNYLLYYSVDEDTKTVSIYYFKHHRRAK